MLLEAFYDTIRNMLNKNNIKATIMALVDKRDGYSMPQEESATLRVINDEKVREDVAYKNAVAAAKAEFTISKNKRVDNQQYGCCQWRLLV